MHLGQLSPWVAAESCKPHHSYGQPPADSINEVVHGISLPPSLQIELRMLGYPLLAYTRGELEDAVNASAVDRTLVENPDAMNFRDKLRPRSRRRQEPPKSCHSSNTPQSRSAFDCEEDDYFLSYH